MKEKSLNDIRKSTNFKEMKDRQGYINKKLFGSLAKKLNHIILYSPLLPKVIRGTLKDNGIIISKEEAKKEALSVYKKGQTLEEIRNLLENKYKSSNLKRLSIFKENKESIINLDTEGINKENTFEIINYLKNHLIRELYLSEDIVNRSFNKIYSLKNLRSEINTVEFVKREDVIIDTLQSLFN